MVTARRGLSVIGGEDFDSVDELQDSAEQGYRSASPHSISRRRRELVKGSGHFLSLVEFVETRDPAPDPSGALGKSNCSVGQIAGVAEPLMCSNHK